MTTPPTAEQQAATTDALEAAIQHGYLRDLVKESQHDRPDARTVVLRNGDESIVTVAMSFIPVHPGDLDNVGLGMTRDQLIEVLAKGHGFAALPLYHRDHVGAGLPHGILFAVAPKWPPHKVVPALPEEWVALAPQADACRSAMRDAHAVEGRESLRLILKEQLQHTPTTFAEAFLDRAVAQGIALALLGEKP